MSEYANPYLYYDRDLLSGLPKNLADEIKSKGLITRGRIEKVSFVGVFLLENKIYVFLPRSTEKVANSEKLLLASNTLSAVEKYGRENKSRIDLMDEGDGRNNLDQLSLIKSLLDDFRINGIYSRRQVERHLNRGKPDWKRTINKIIPFPNKNEQPIYLDLYGVTKRYFSNSEIALIHASVIQQLDIKFSWLITCSSHPIASSLKSYQSPNGNIKYQIAKLTAELTQVFSDRDIKLIKGLIKYLKNQGGDEQSTFIAGLENFHFCWEHMLGKVLSGTVNLNSQLPAPVYLDNNNNILNADKKGMRTDIILHDENANSFTVADAKYYAATKVADAPGWGDIVKQLFYEKALKQLKSSSTIKNAFIFPGTNGNLKEARIRDKLNSSNDQVVYIDDFKPIYCYYVDPMKVIESYLKGNKMKKLSANLLEKVS